MKYLYKVSPVLVGILFAVVLVFLNVVGSMVPWKIDVSPNSVYSLSSSSKKILAEIKEKVSLTVYMSVTLPPRLAPIKADLFDLLDEYKRYGKITVSVINPETDQKTQEDAQAKGITKLQFSDVQNDQFSLKTGYFGAFLQYHDKTEVLPALLNPNNLEYDLTSALYRLTREESPKVGIVAKSKFQLLTGLNALLKQQFDFKLTDFGNIVDSSLDGLIVKDDRLTSLTEAELKELDTYVRSGKLLVIFADGVWVDEQIQTLDTGHNLNIFLKKYGVQINRDLVLSTYAETATFNVGGVAFVTRYPFWLKAGKRDFSPGLSFVTESTAPLFPWVSSLKLQGNSGTKAMPLIYAPVPSVLQTGSFQLLPNQIKVRYPDKQKQRFIIGAQVNAGKGTIIVIPSSRFIEDSFAGQNSANLIFVSKLLDTYLSHGALSGINPRSIQYTQLMDVPDSVKQTVRWGNIILPSLVFIGLGVWLHFRRKKQVVL